MKTQIKRKSDSPASNKQVKASDIMMIKVNVRLDTRRPKEDGTCPLVASFSALKGTALIPLGLDLLPSQWDARQRTIIRHPQKAVLNNFVTTQVGAISDALITLQFGGYLKGMRKVSEVKRLLLDYLDDPECLERGAMAPADTLLRLFDRYARSRKAMKTRESYLGTLQHITDYLGEDGASVTFDDIDVAWLRGFDGYLTGRGLAVNSIAIHMRNLRAVCNFAIDEGVTNQYPFRRFKIRQQATRKRSLSVEDLRAFFSAEVTDDQRLHLDVFKLIFMLIGINMVDLAKLTEIENGRIHYRRSKTGRLYSIKVEPEALEIIDRYRGKGHLLSVFDRYTDHRNYTQHINKSLKTIGSTSIGKQGRRTFAPLQPEITAYWARHTWATIASSLDIPKETIAHALGHGGNSVTDIYIDFDQRKVDDANRRVLDWVLYGKR